MTDLYWPDLSEYAFTQRPIRMNHVSVNPDNWRDRARQAWARSQGEGIYPRAYGGFNVPDGRLAARDAALERARIHPQLDSPITWTAAEIEAAQATAPDLRAERLAAMRKMTEQERRIWTGIPAQFYAQDIEHPGLRPGE